MTDHDFYGQANGAALGDPAQDPPMTVRVHPDDDPADQDARRVIRTADVSPTGLWILVTGDWGVGNGHYHADVADWPVQYPIRYCATYRHAAAEAQRRGQVRSDERGDMDVTAFKD